MKNTKKTTKEIGDEGENKASVFLENKGYLILERNYRRGRNEVDIICQTNQLLIFVEVKRRSSSQFGFGEDFVDDKKMERLQEVAEYYLEKIDWEKDIRFDIIAISSNDIKHFEDV